MLEQRPEGLPRPRHKTVLKFFENIVSGGTEIFPEMESNQSLDRLWLVFLQGAYHFNRREYELGLKKFLEVDETEYYDDSAQRVRALALKKIAEYNRKRNNFEESHGWHRECYNLLRRIGSQEEILDICMRLQEDCRHLNDFSSALKWLSKAAQAAESLKDRMSRFRFLADINSLKAECSLCLHDFQMAEKSAHRAHTYWNDYTSLGIDGENKILWANWEIAQIYEAWANHLSLENSESKNSLLVEAKKYYELCQNMAEKLSLSHEEKQLIANKKIQIPNA